MKHTLVYDHIQPLPTRHSLFIQNPVLLQPSAPVGWISLRSLCWYEQWVTGKRKKGVTSVHVCTCAHVCVCVCDIICSRPTSVRAWLQCEEFMKQPLYQQLFMSLRPQSERPFSGSTVEKRIRQNTMKMCGRGKTCRTLTAFKRYSTRLCSERWFVCSIRLDYISFVFFCFSWKMRNCS